MSVPFQRSECAPVLRVFGDHAVRIAALARVRPSLLHRLTFSPCRAIHSVGAYLHLSAATDLPDTAVAELLDERDPRSLLQAVFPNAPPHLYRALDRAGDHVRERHFYERLGVLCDTPLSGVLLSAGNLDDARLDWAEAVLSMDPFILTLPVMMSRSVHEIEAVDTMIAFLRAYGAFMADELRLPDRCGMKALYARIQHALDQVMAPPPPFALPAPYRIIDSIGELRATGRALKNCVESFRPFATSHWFRVASGSTVYVTCETPPMLASVRRVAPGLWTVDEICGEANVAIDSATQAQFVDALAVAGVRLVKQYPSHALAVIYRAAKKQREGGVDDDDGDEGLEDLADEWLAA